MVFKADWNCAIVFEIVLADGLEHLQARALVLLREDHVETNYLDLVVVEQLVQELPQVVAPPGPTPFFRQTFLVDFDDDDHGDRPPVAWSASGGAS